MTSFPAVYTLGDMVAQYSLDAATGFLSLSLVPLGWQHEQKEKHCAPDPIVQLHIRGDRFSNGFANGHTLRGSASLDRFRFKEQRCEHTAGGQTIVTFLKADDDQELRHTLLYQNGSAGVAISTAYRNGSETAVTLEMLSSFCLGGLTPFIADDAPNSLVVHRLRSKWSNEARLESLAAEGLQLEPSWSGYGVACERFGQVGSMPVRRFFPFAAVEDTQHHIIWGAQLACPSSWQMELYRRDDGLCLSGGLADYEFGHWCKTLSPGESLQTPTSYVSVCKGDIDTLCTRLTSMQEMALDTMRMPARLPVIFNEFCTTWGHPSQESIGHMLPVLQNRDIDYFVIDAGWYADEIKGWEANMGDWEVSQTLFPEGLEPVVAAIRQAGMQPGLWFETEVCGEDARVFSETDHLLTRHGEPITAGTRRFWNLCDPWTEEYLNERVIGLLQRLSIAYVKIDYNDSIGIGCDHPDSLGEGLRQNQLAALSLLNRIRGAVPGIVIENCSSGGHRLEPSFLGVCQLASFSDAHEVREIPIIAANLHRAMLPRQSLIWAVLRHGDSVKRLVWSLAATFLGVMCLSGDVHDLSDAQWAVVDEAIGFYRAVSPIIERGTSRRYGPKISSYRHPSGWQAVVRTSPDTRETLIVAHAFDQVPVTITLPVQGSCRILRRFADEACQVTLHDDTLTITLSDGACALHLARQ